MLDQITSFLFQIYPLIIIFCILFLIGTKIIINISNTITDKDTQTSTIIDNKIQTNIITNKKTQTTKLNFYINKLFVILGAIILFWLISVTLTSIYEYTFQYFFSLILGNIDYNILKNNYEGLYFIINNYRKVLSIIFFIISSIVAILPISSRKKLGKIGLRILIGFFGVTITIDIVTHILT